MNYKHVLRKKKVFALRTLGAELGLIYSKTVFLRVRSKHLNWEFTLITIQV